MTVLEIAQIGNPVIRAMAEPVDESEMGLPLFQTLIDDMVDTMRDAGGVGIAAPQVGVSKRLFVIEVRNPDRYRNAEPYPLTVVINPSLTYLSSPDEPLQSWEGCLSVEGLRGRLPRYGSVRLEGVDRHGERVLLELDGFPAVVAQHETDHLNGKVYLDRMPDMLTLCFESEYRKFQADAQKQSEDAVVE